MVSNWKTSNITDLLKPNGIKIGPFGSQLKKELFIQNGDYKVYGQENVYAQNFKIGDRYMTRSHFDKLRSCELLPGDFVMSTMGTVGKCAIVPAHITRGIMDSHLIRLRFDEKVIDKTYLLQLFSPDIQFLKDQTDKLSVGGIMDGLSVKIVSSLTVGYPSTVEEQKAIVNALSAADGMISSLEKLIAKKKAIKQGAMQELLTGKKRLPGFTREWTIKCIDDIATIMDNCRIPVKESDREKMAGTIPYCGANGIVGYVNDYTIDDEIILIAEDGGYFDEYATRPIAYKMSGKCWVNNHAHILKSKSNTDQNYLFYCLVHKDIRDFISSGTRSKLNKADLLKITIKLPLCLAEQIAIASILSDMDNEIEALEQKLAKARQIKQGMMQQLLTGKIRLV